MEARNRTGAWAKALTPKVIARAQALQRPMTLKNIQKSFNQVPEKRIKRKDVLMPRYALIYFDIFVDSGAEPVSMWAEQFYMQGCGSVKYACWWSCCQHD
jgi:hypothetical protein